MELDNHLTFQLSELLADPAKAGPADRAVLEDLIQQFPYFQPLHLLLARAVGQERENAQIFAAAALYTSESSLQHFLEKKEFRPRGLKSIALQRKNKDTIPENTAAATSVKPLDILQVLSAAVADPQKLRDHADYRPFRNGELAERPVEEIQRRPEHDFAVESIASSDFFAFEQNFGTEIPEAEMEPLVPAADNRMAAMETDLREPGSFSAADNIPAAEKASVSNYHDENLPYTFLWWLAKTRKEHQSIFQPYAVQKTRTEQQNPELQQQYVEHIFHLQSPLTGEPLLPESADAKPAGKEFELIDSFIKNDPQITPPKAEQIDTENKAKKSAEDQNDLVSETLAHIYIEQMLYDKAIDTYEKLSLKFPEKSRYFADLIQSIQKKI